MTGQVLTFSDLADRHRRDNRQIETTASLDRIDSDQGYILGNIQWVHKIVNIMKQDTVQSEFIGWCRAVVAHADGKA